MLTKQELLAAAARAETYPLGQADRWIEGYEESENTDRAVNLLIEYPQTRALG